MKVEQKIEGLATTTPYSSTRPVEDNEELEKDLKENINSQVLAVQICCPLRRDCCVRL